jgi:ribosomal protein S12 methylthiotransferase accessory factor
MIAEYDIDRVQSVIDRTVDARVGIIHHLEPLPVRAGAPRFFHFSAQLCNLGACGWQSNLTRMEGGAATRQEAQASALFDALGCYAAAFYAPRELALFPHESAPSQAVSPRRFALFSSEQYSQHGFPYEPFTETVPVRWIPATSMDSGDRWYVPAAASLLPYAVRAGTAERPIQPSSPIGLACSCSAEDAVLSAISDVIKHDALALCWNGRLSPPHVRIETLSDESYEVVERLETIGRVTALNITLDEGIPTFLLCLRCPAEEAPAMVFGAGCHPIPERAFRLAMDELALVLRRCQDLSPRDSRRTSADAPPFADGAERLAFWCAHEHAANAAFLFASSERIEFEEVAPLAAGSASLPGDALAGALRERGFDVFIADLTTPDLREVGVTVVRAVIPGLQPLFAAPHEQALGGTRLDDIPARLRLKSGRPERALPQTGLPHPFLLKGIDS